jgi:hypothetical protein
MCRHCNNPIYSHLHLIATDGCFSGSGTFTKCHEPEPKDLARYIIRACFSAERMTFIEARDTKDLNFGNLSRSIIRFLGAKTTIFMLKTVNFRTVNHQC